MIKLYYEATCLSGVASEWIHMRAVEVRLNPHAVDVNKTVKT